MAGSCHQIKMRLSIPKDLPLAKEFWGPNIVIRLPRELSLDGALVGGQSWEIGIDKRLCPGVARRARTRTLGPSWKSFEPIPSPGLEPER